MKTVMQVPQVNKQSLRASEHKSMKLAFLLCLLFGALTFACSKKVPENNSSPANLSTSPVVDNLSAKTVENASSPDPKNDVVFDGKNYIKKNGWKVPPRRDLYKNETNDNRPEQRNTKTGKRVFTTTSEYIYKIPWHYSQDFNFEGNGFDLMRGQLESVSFLEMNANGKVFFYSIFTEKVVSPPSSNNDPHEDPFRYRIMDADGDGIFETLLGDDVEIIVPDWVLR